MVIYNGTDLKNNIDSFVQNIQDKFLKLLADDFSSVSNRREIRSTELGISYADLPLVECIPFLEYFKEDASIISIDKYEINGNIYRKQLYREESKDINILFSVYDVKGENYTFAYITPVQMSSFDKSIRISLCIDSLKFKDDKYIYLIITQLTLALVLILAKNLYGVNTFENLYDISCIIQTTSELTWNCLKPLGANKNDVYHSIFDTVSELYLYEKLATYFYGDIISFRNILNGQEFSILDLLNKFTRASIRYGMWYDDEATDEKDILNSIRLILEKNLLLEK